MENVDIIVQKTRRNTMTDEKKFDPSRELPKADRITDDGVMHKQAPSLQPWTILVPKEMIVAVEYIIENAKGLGFEDSNEFVRSAIRDKIAQINNDFNR
jgi:hypothetical protein